jgi:hypothetical protein
MLYKGGLKIKKMNKHIRKYYINGTETTLETTLKYIEIMLTHSNKQIENWGVRYEDSIVDNI